MPNQYLSEGPSSEPTRRRAQKNNDEPDPENEVLPIDPEEELNELFDEGDASPGDRRRDPLRR